MHMRSTWSVLIPTVLPVAVAEFVAASPARGQHIAAIG
jgi:hypothetical protein